MFNHMDGIRKVMIVDLDAHQGNGHERDFLHDSKVYIFDCYNKWIYPNDKPAKGWWEWQEGVAGKVKKWSRIG